MAFVLPGSVRDSGRSLRPSLLAFSTSALETLNSLMAFSLSTEKRPRGMRLNALVLNSKEGEKGTVNLASLGEID